VKASVRLKRSDRADKSPDKGDKPDNGRSDDK
jgi:hypothetical protein